MAIEQINTTLAMASSRQLALCCTPIFPAEVVMDPIQGPAQEYGVDFTVSGNIVSWDPGSDLDSILNSGETPVLRFIYTRSI